MPLLRAIGDDLIIHPFEHPPKIGSLWIPETTKKRVNQGIVVHKGPLCSDDIEISDHVLFNGYTGDQVAIETTGKFFVIPESHIIAIVQPSDVVLMDVMTIKRLIQERFGELKSMEITSISDPDEFMEGIAQSLLDRIDTLSVAEGYEF